MNARSKRIFEELSRITFRLEMQFSKMQLEFDEAVDLVDFWVAKQEDEADER